MSFYICIYIVFLFIVFVDRYTVNKQNKLLINISIVILVLVAGLRWYPTEISRFGLFDYGAYIDVYNAMPSISILLSNIELYSEYYYMESGYLILNSIFKTVFNAPPNYFLLFFSCISIFYLYKAINLFDLKKEACVVFFFFLFRLYFQYNYIMMRQGLSTVLVWCALASLMHNDNRKYFLYIIVASMFHTSAIIGILALFVRRIRINRYIAVLIIIGSFVFGLIGKGVVQNMISSSAILTEMAGSYLELEKTGNLLNYVELLIFFIPAFIFSKDLQKRDSTNYMFNLFLVYSIVLSFSIINMVFIRLTSYFIICYAYMWIWMLKNKRSFSDKTYYSAFIIVYLIIYGVRLLTNYGDFNNYNCFIFQ